MAKVRYIKGKDLTTPEGTMHKLSILTLLLFSLTLVSAIGNTIPVQIQTTDDLGNIETGTFEFTLNISNSSTCSPVLYSNISNFTTDNRGIVSYDISVDLAFDEQYYLCYYRDGVSKDNKTIGTNPYAFRANTTNYALGTLCSGTEYLAANGSCLDVSSIAGDTNETTRFNALANTDCSGTDKVIGVYTNGTVLCGADAGQVYSHLSNFTEDILWTTSFNNTFDSRGDARYVNIDGDTMTGNLTIVGNISADLGDFDRLTIVGTTILQGLTMSQNIIPITTELYTLGNSTNWFEEIWVNNVYSNFVNATTLNSTDINTENIDTTNMTLGGYEMYKDGDGSLNIDLG